MGNWQRTIKIMHNHLLSGISHGVGDNISRLWVPSPPPGDYKQLFVNDDIIGGFFDL